MSDDHAKHIGNIYREWRAAEAVLDTKRNEHYEAAARRNELYKALNEAFTPGEEVTVDHGDHVATITAEYHRAMPGHRMVIKIEGEKGVRDKLQFGTVPDGEKVSRRKV